MTTPQQSATGAPATAGPRWFWTQFEPAGSKAGKTPDGADVAALVLGLTIPAGEAPLMWRYYRTWIPDDLAARGIVPDRFIAEHMTLALFGFHQQNQGRLMHAPGVRLGTAARALHESFSKDGVDSRMSAAAQARTLNAAFFQLRGLVSQLSTIGQPLDYTRLLRDLQTWTFPDSRSRTIRTWGADYNAWTGNSPDTGTA